MRDEWRFSTLKDAGGSVLACEPKTPPPTTAGYPYIAIPQLKHGRLDLREARLISREHLLEWNRRSTPKEHDVVLSRRCNPGETAVVPLGLQCALGQNLVLLRSDGSAVHPPFLRWLVRSPTWWDQIAKFLNVGAVFDSLRCADIPNFELPIPPMRHQRAIAHILGTLDDKIELNRRTNETLEAMARALFKSWFVDFDPVHAKAAGKQPSGMDAATAALFPSEFVESELGRIPKGWNPTPIGQLASVVGGSTPSTTVERFWSPSDHWWATPKDFAGLRTHVLLKTERCVSSVGLAQISSGLLAPGTVLMSSRAPIGYLAITEIPVAVNQGFIAMIPAQGVSNLYLLRWAEASQPEILSRANGSTFLEISKSNFRPILVVAPPPSLHEALDARARPLHQRVVSGERESACLAALRDTLLPRLLSGDLPIPDAERFVEAAT